MNESICWAHPNMQSAQFYWERMTPTHDHVYVCAGPGRARASQCAVYALTTLTIVCA